ncbi:MAG: hypothetical protein SGI92_06720 [Bryobacteraceae bacterium]|nr:hypothetical protein [Bryobacteraceae bacterium]
MRVDPGFRTERLVQFDINPGQSGSAAAVVAWRDRGGRIEPRADERE